MYLEYWIQFVLPSFIESKMIITVDILKTIAPGSKKTNYKLLPDLAHWMNEWFPHFEIDTTQELRHLLSQWAHESNSFNTLEEYASGKAYEGRTDLGNLVKGDGERYKGRGPTQTTGRTNYLRLGEKLHKPNMFLDNPELLETAQWGVWSSCVFWDDRSLNNIANMADNVKIPYKVKGEILQVSPLEYISRKINGGTNGLLSRSKFYERSKSIIK